MTTDLENPIVGYECKNVIHIPRASSDAPDIHLIKEVIHYKDGTLKPNLRYIKNFKRKIWVTNRTKRDHVQKKEYEHLDNLTEYECTQSDLVDTVARALDMRNSSMSKNLRSMQNSPYLYGADVDSVSFIKYNYKKKWPTLFSESTNCGFDTETDMVHGHKQIIIASAFFKDEGILGCTKDYMSGYSNPEEAFKKAFERHNKDNIDINKVTFFVVDRNIDILIRIFSWIHNKKPDFVTIWHMDFDINKIIDCCKENDYPIHDLLSDPSVPESLRFFKYRQGTSSKTTASGVFKSKPPQDIWNVVSVPASFCFIDPMCLYRQIRITGALEPGYSLDAVAKRQEVSSKLSFKPTEGLSKEKWHQVMQTSYKDVYLVYALIDPKVMLNIDEKIKDIAYTVQPSTGYSDYSRFNSQPKKIHDEYFFYCLEERQFVLATLPNDVVEDETVEDMKADKLALERAKYGEEEEAEKDDDEEELNIDNGGYHATSGTLGLKGWVLTLDPQNSVLGLKTIEDEPSLHSNIRKFGYDSDATAAYPTIKDICNVSKSTTTKELIAIQGIPREVFRMQNLNFILGATNSIEYCTTMHQLPKPYELLNEFKKEIASIAM
jgi:hypothetical protein